MQEKRKDPDFNMNERDQNKKSNLNGEERFESDSQKIVHRHLENEDDIITHDDIASVRIGLTPADLDEATAARFGDDDAKEKAEHDILGDVEENEEDDNIDNKPITPWDTIDPK